MIPIATVEVVLATTQRRDVFFPSRKGAIFFAKLPKESENKKPASFVAHSVSTVFQKDFKKKKP